MSVYERERVYESVCEREECVREREYVYGRVCMSVCVCVCV
jgi:hypothetical protein